MARQTYDPPDTHGEEGAYLEDGLERLREAGHKITDQRRAILALFDREAEHLTPNEVFESLEDRMPSLSLATVYNTLELLEAKQLVTRVVSNDGQTYFDPTVTPHHHAVCGECGEIVDMNVDREAIEAVAEATQSMDHEQSGFEVTAANVWFEGRCTGCEEP